MPWDSGVGRLYPWRSTKHNAHMFMLRDAQDGKTTEQCHMDLWAWPRGSRVYILSPSSYTELEHIYVVLSSFHPQFPTGVTFHPRCRYSSYKKSKFWELLVMGKSLNSWTVSFQLTSHHKANHKNQMLSIFQDLSIFKLILLSERKGLALGVGWMLVWLMIFKCWCWMDQI